MLRHILILLILSLGAYFLLTKGSNQKSSKNKVTHSKKPPLDRKNKNIRTSANSSVKTSKGEKLIKIPSQKKPSLNLKPTTSVANPFQKESNEIPYRIENGWAIAHGDILLGKVEAPANVKTGSHTPKRSRLWDSSTIPYGIHPDILNKAPIKAAIQYFNENTVIQLVPHDGQEEDAIIFVPDKTNCASYIGRIGGAQPIMVAKKCRRQELIHEIMHALGFVHEHARRDRNKYLEVLWNNIKPEYWPQFSMVPDSLIHEYRGSVFDFDPRSSMLYHPKAFVKKEHQISLRAIGNHDLSPTTDGLSEVDRERVYYLYGN